MIENLPILALGFVAGGIVMSVVVWKLMLFGADKVVRQMILQGFFIHEGVFYSVSGTRHQ